MTRRRVTNGVTDGGHWLLKKALTGPCTSDGRGKRAFRAEDGHTAKIYLHDTYWASWEQREPQWIAENLPDGVLHLNLFYMAQSMCNSDWTNAGRSLAFLHANDTTRSPCPTRKLVQMPVESLPLIHGPAIPVIQQSVWESTTRQALFGPLCSFH